MNQIPRFFIDRPIFAAAIAILTVLVGGIAAIQLPVAQYPNITPPTVSVTANYPGANAETVANTVAAPLEQQINGVDHMLYISSTSTSDGQMTITVTFQPGVDPDTAQVLVQNRVQAGLPKLPQTVRDNGVVVRKRSPDFTMAVSIMSPDDSRTDLYLSNFAYLQVSDYLARIKGVGDSQFFGAREYSMRVWLNPEKIASLNLTPGDVVQALREQNMQIPAGTIGGQPAPAGLDFQMTVTTQGRLQDVSQFEDIVIKTGDQNEVVRLKEVARVELGAKDHTVISRLDGKPAINIGGFLLVVVVVLIFLQSWRSPLIPIPAVPVLLIGTFAIMLPFGFSLNLLTWLGLVLAIGIVVDDAIVVVEAVEHHLSKGVKHREATLKAMEEVAGPIVAMSLVLAAVFIPTAFIPELTGSFYRQFALTIAFSTILSMINSLTLSPALCALFLQAPKEKKDVLGRFLDGTFSWLFRLFNRVFGGVQRAYTATLRGFFRFKYIAIAGYLLLIGLTAFMFEKVPTGFIPETDQGGMFVNVELPEGASIERTTKVMDQVEDILKKTPGIAHTINRIGSSSVTQATAPNTGTLICVFDSFEERKSDPQKSLTGILKHLTPEFAKITGARAGLHALPREYAANLRRRQPHPGEEQRRVH